MREIEAVRRHLAPFRSRAALARSYAREAFHVLPGPADDEPGAVRLAYALRWLELGPSDGHAAARAAGLVTSGGPSVRTGRSGGRSRRWRPAIQRSICGAR
ncbi:MAG: hypothetical protein ACLGIJ_00250 [Candidatus Limnocylindria bacterium]